MVCSKKVKYAIIYWGEKMTIGQRIRVIRTTIGMTQKQLGERSSMADSAIRKYESEKINPKLETIKKIADALEVPTEILLDDKYDFLLSSPISAKDLIETMRRSEKEAQRATGEIIAMTKALVPISQEAWNCLEKRPNFVNLIDDMLQVDEFYSWLSYLKNYVNRKSESLALEARAEQEGLSQAIKTANTAVEMLETDVIAMQFRSVRLADKLAQIRYESAKSEEKQDTPEE